MTTFFFWFSFCKTSWSFNKLWPRLSKRQQSLQKTDVFGNRLNYRQNGKTISKHWAENWSNYAGKLAIMNWPATLKLLPNMQMLPVPIVILYLKQLCCRNSINNSKWQKMQLKWKSTYVLKKSFTMTLLKLYVKLLSWWIPDNSNQEDLSPPWNVVIGSR